MKYVQIRVSDDVHKALELAAKDEGTSITEFVRRGIQVYGIVRAYRKEGKKLAIIDKDRHVLAELLIPGITVMEPGHEELPVHEAENSLESVHMR